MAMHTSRIHAAAAALLITLSTPVLADTFVVDDDGGPGVDFTDLPPAVAFAGAGDVLLVSPGSYSPFDLQKGLTVLGSGTTTVVGSGVRVQQMPYDQIAVLADLRVADLTLASCDGTVILDGLTATAHGPASTRVVISECIDVRLRDSTFHGEPTALRIDASRVEVADCTLTGADGEDEDCGDADDGYTAVFVNTSRVHFAAPDVLGGEGGETWATCISLCGGLGGNGGAGVEVTGSETFVTGRPGDRIQGGPNGLGMECACDGRYAGDGMLVGATTLRYDDLVVMGGDAWYPWCSWDGDDVVDLGGNDLTIPSDREPTLVSSDVPMPGQPYTVTVHGQPGASARFYLGRHPDLGFTAADQIERMTSEERVVDLGAIPATGQVTLDLTMPSNVTAGFAFFAQVEVVNPNGVFQRTNSLPMIMR